MLRAPLRSASSSPWAGQTTVSCRGRVQLAPQMWQSIEVLAGCTSTTRRPALSALATRILVNWVQPASRIDRFSPALAPTCAWVLGGACSRGGHGGHAQLFEGDGVEGVAQRAGGLGGGGPPR